MNETDLTLEIIGKGNSLPPFSARECTQTLTPLPRETMRRTINGVLVFVGNKGHRKFHSLISCKDKASPAFGDVWKGSRLKVGCLQYLTQVIPQNVQTIELERPAVSLCVLNPEGKVLSIGKTEERTLFLTPPYLGGFVTYRPLLFMIVKNYHLETDEWGQTVGWSLELEEE